MSNFTTNNELYTAAQALKALASGPVNTIIAASPTLNYYANGVVAQANGEAKVGTLANASTGVLNTN